MSSYEELSEQRKKLQASGDIPSWYTTGGYQLFCEKYLEEGQSLRQRYEVIAKTAAKYAYKLFGDDFDWYSEFFNIMWSGWLSPSTPLLANMGTDRGMPISCSGGHVDDSILGFYSARLEAAMLTKNGFGTSGYLGDIRSRGSAISKGGKATGVLPVFKGFVQDMQDVSQAGIRRGSWAGYLPVEHGDFFELADYLEHNPGDLNVGWNISNDFIDRLNSGDSEAIKKYQKILRVRKLTGKGYLEFIDKVNAQNPQMYKDLGLTVKASNLCNEIQLFSDKDHTFSCVLSSMNLAFYDEWKDTDAVFFATVFLDCVVEAFLEQATGQEGFSNIVRFTERGRALGLGTMGFHTYLQDRMLPIEGLMAYNLNTQIFKNLDAKTLEASKWMAEKAGEPEWCKGYGVRNTHRISIAPNMSTALICGGVSQGIEPVIANAYTQVSAGGEINRLNPSLLRVMTNRGVYNSQTVDHILANAGSVRNVDWLSDEEKLVFRTAFEVDQTALLRLASNRQKYIDQGQSLNLFFSADEDPKVISQVHRAAAEDPYIKGLYYMRSAKGVVPSSDCVACES